MTFNIKAKQEELAKIMGALNTLVDEATIEVDVEGLKFRGMDPSHIALLDMNYPSSAFESFGVDAPQKFGVRVAELLKVLKRFKDTVELSEKDSLLHVSGDGKSYKLHLIEASASSTPLPKLNFEVKAELNREELDKILSDIQVVSEYIQLIAEGEGENHSFGAVGRGDSGEANIGIDTEASGNGKATYSLDYLIKVVKAVKSDKPVVLEFSSKMPLHLSFEENRIQYYLAPRVQD